MMILLTIVAALEVFVCVCVCVLVCVCVCNTYLHIGHWSLQMIYRNIFFVFTIFLSTRACVRALSRARESTRTCVCAILTFILVVAYDLQE